MVSLYNIIGMECFENKNLCPILSLTSESSFRFRMPVTGYGMLCGQNRNVTGSWQESNY